MTMLDPRLPELDAGPYVLRPFRLGDAAALVEAGRDPLIPLITTVPAAGGLEERGAYVRRQWGRLEEGLGWSWAIGEPSVGSLVGQIGLWPRGGMDERNENVTGGHGARVATSGYWVLPSKQGRRAAAWALEAVVRWGFESAGLDRVELAIDPTNTGSIHTAQRVGFVCEDGIQRWEEIGGVSRALDVYVLEAGV